MADDKWLRATKPLPVEIKILEAVGSLLDIPRTPNTSTFYKSLPKITNFPTTLDHIKQDLDDSLQTIKKMVADTKLVKFKTIYALGKQMTHPYLDPYSNITPGAEGNELTDKEIIEKNNNYANNGKLASHFFKLLTEIWTKLDIEDREKYKWPQSTTIITDCSRDSFLALKDSARMKQHGKLKVASISPPPVVPPTSPITHAADPYALLEADRLLSENYNLEKHEYSLEVLPYSDNIAKTLAINEEIIFVGKKHSLTPTLIQKPPQALVISPSKLLSSNPVPKEVLSTNSMNILIVTYGKITDVNYLEALRWGLKLALPTDRILVKHYIEETDIVGPKKADDIQEVTNKVKEALKGLEDMDIDATAEVLAPRSSPTLIVKEIIQKENIGVLVLLRSSPIQWISDLTSESQSCTTALIRA